MSPERSTELNAAELIGDLCAPEGSRHWCIGMRFEIQKLLDQYETDHEQLQMCVDAFVQHEGWRHLGFGDYTSFCLAKKPHGLGRSPEEIRQVVAEGRQKAAQQLAADPEVKALAEHGTNSGQEEGHSNGMSETIPGNSSSYLVRRLKRDAPEVAAALARGEYPSARAAAIAAGIVKVPTVLDVLRKAWRKASQAERREFAEWIYTPEAE